MSHKPHLVLATRNADKVRELSVLFGELPVSGIQSAAELGAPDVVEDGETLQANALKKARELAEFTSLISIADDTGLEVDALSGAPGVYSARFAGEGCSYQDNCRKLLQELDGVAEDARSARFRTVVALVDPNARVEMTCDGDLLGRIALEARGDAGFGYDPVFELLADGPELKQLGLGGSRTLAQLSLEQKNQISHRGRAARWMRTLLGHYLNRYYKNRSA